MKKRNIISVCLAFLMVVGFTSITSAYTLWNYGYADPDIDYKPSGVASIYLTAMSNGKNAWNNSSVDCTVSSNSGSYNYLGTITGSAYGVYEVLAYSNGDPQHKTTWFRIGMSSEKFPLMSTNSRQSVCVHELGHAMGLDDQSDGTRIMNVNRDRSTIYAPKSDDKNGVNANW